MAEYEVALHISAQTLKTYPSSHFIGQGRSYGQTGCQSGGEG